MSDGNSLPTIKDKLSADAGPFTTITGVFKSVNYGNGFLDTNVEIQIPTFYVTWSDRQKVLDELAKVLEKYQI